MIFPFVLLMISLVCYIDRYQKLQAAVDFPEDLQTWCPYTKFCHLNASKPIPLDNLTGREQFEPCCRPCSCSIDCGLRRDCCHSSYDLYNVDKVLGTVCKALNTKDWADHYQDSDSFHIIDKCPNEFEKCNESNVSIYGSFSPVYSKTNGRIYYNHLCAKCHYQTEADILVFPPFMSCSIVPNRNIMEIIDGLRSKSKDCFVQFLVPNHIDISNNKCYRHTIRGCHKNGLQQYRDNCAAFNATFTKTFVYQNVYCYLCNKLNPMSVNVWEEKNYTKCPVYEQPRDFSSSALSVLLDRESVEIHEQSLGNQFAYNYMCFGESKLKQEQNCRPIKCPEGQIRLGKSCRIFGSRWFIQKPKLYITLTPTDKSNNLTVHHLQQVTYADLMSAQKEFITRHELQDWDIDLYYKLQAENENLVQFVLATLMTNNQLVNPEIFISKIQRSLSENWGMKINDEHRKLKPDFNKYKTYFSMVDNGSQFTPFDVMDADFGLSHDIIYGWSEKSSYKLSTKGYFISKLFFCDRIELFEGEFVQISPEIIYINRSMKYLGNAEYEPMQETNMLISGVRVCLKDVLFDGNFSNKIEINITLFFMTLYVAFLNAVKFSYVHI